jgi:predicted ATPase
MLIVRRGCLPVLRVCHVRFVSSAPTMKEQPVGNAGTPTPKPKRSPTDIYENLVAQGRLINDPKQRVIVAQMSKLAEALPIHEEAMAGYWVVRHTHPFCACRSPA